MTTTSQLRREVIDFLAEYLLKEAADLNLNLTLDSLGVDSLERQDLTFELECEFDVKQAHLTGATTLLGIINQIDTQTPQ